MKYSGKDFQCYYDIKEPVKKPKVSPKKEGDYCKYDSDCGDPKMCCGVAMDAFVLDPRGRESRPKIPFLHYLSTCGIREPKYGPNDHYWKGKIVGADKAKTTVNYKIQANSTKFYSIRQRTTNNDNI